MPIYVLSVLCGFSFFDFLKIGELPVFQLLMGLTILFYGFSRGKFQLPKLQNFVYYKYFIVVSIVPFLYSLIFYSKGFLTYVYGVFPLVLAMVSFGLIDRKKYTKMLKLVVLSMFGVTLIGWLIFLRLIPIDSFFEASGAELDLGYFGIRYMSSTRNSDYLYPLIGLAISLYFFLATKRKIYISLFIYFNLGLIISSSRGAIIISVLSLILIFRQNKTKITLLLPLIISVILIFLNREVIISALDNKYYAIINSMFSIRSSDVKFSNDERIDIVYDSIVTAIQYPFGVGIDNYSSVYANRVGVRISNSAENAYLTYLVERGWLAFLFFSAFVASTLKKAYSYSDLNLNKFLALFIALYFVFNYELNNVFANFCIYLILLDTQLRLTESYHRNAK